MQYDPIKRSLGKVFDQTPVFRKIFYRLLDLLLLRTWYVKKELRKLNPGNAGIILDAGSGFGQYTYRMSRMFRKAVILAVDVKEEQIEQCNAFFKQIGDDSRVHFQVEDLVGFVRPQQFELILSVDVMEHIEEDMEVFKNFWHSLKKGGMLLISTPSDQGGSDVHDHTDGVQGFIEEHVRDGYNIHEIESKLKTAGFSKVEARYSYGPAGKISWRFSMKYPIRLLGVSKLFFVLLPFYYLVVYPLAAVLNYIDVNGNHSSGTGLIVKAWK